MLTPGLCYNVVMNYRYGLLAIPLVCGSLVAQAAIQSCGDGNQLYTQAKHGDTVRYFASINEFEVTRTSESRVRVTDSVDCRYGTDTLENIESIVFLDSTVNTDELVQHNNTKNLARSIIQSVLSSRLATQIRGAGGDPDVAQTTDAGYTPGSTGTTGSLSVTTNSNYPVYTPNTNYNYSGNTTTNTTANTGTYSTYNNYSSPYSTYGTYTNYNTYTNPYATYGNYGSYGASQYSNSNWYTNYQNQNSAGAVNVSWSTASVGANDTVYIEAVTAAGARHYLGTAVGYQANKQVAVPASLSGAGEVTIQVRSNTRVLNSYTTTF